MSSTSDPSHPQPALEILGLRFRFPPASPASSSSQPWLIEIEHLALDPAEQLLLSAPSGCGKSTLIHLIAGLLNLRLPHAAGRINVAGRNIHALLGPARDQYRGRAIGMIFQTHNLLQGFSALDNVLAPLLFSTFPRSDHDARAKSLLASLGIHQLDQRIETMSLGQQQRVAVARALVHRPALVLADEPTASLDPDNARAAIDLIQSVCREHAAALLLVSHDPAIPSRFKRVQTLTRPASVSSEVN